MIKSMTRSSVLTRTDYRSMLAGNEAFMPSAMELISTAYGTGSSSTITFSSIPQTYKHLELRWTARGTTAWDSFTISFNGSGMTKSHHLYGESTVNSGSPNTGQLWASVAASSAASGIHASGILSVLDYASTSKNKTARTLHGNYDPGYATQIVLSSHFQASTSAVSSLTVSGWNGVNFTTTSRFSLYGIKG